MKLDFLINQFRIASRELFNQYFRVEDPYNNDNAWIFDERHGEIESLLFQKMVLEPAELPIIENGYAHSGILVEPAFKDSPINIMLNREINSGYWDFPIEHVTSEAKLMFLYFFDWDQLSIRDNHFVCVEVLDWKSHPETIGKRALVETLNVKFKKA